MGARIKAERQSEAILIIPVRNDSAVELVIAGEVVRNVCFGLCFQSRSSVISKHSERGQKGSFFFFFFAFTVSPFLHAAEAPRKSCTSSRSGRQGPCRRQNSKRGTRFSLFYEIIVPRDWGEGSVSLSFLQSNLVSDVDTITAVHTKVGHWVAKAPAFWMEN